VVKCKGTNDRLWAWIEESGAEMDSKEDFSETWTVTVRITLEPAALKHVVKCMKAPPAPAKKDSTAKPSSYTVQ